MKNSNVLKVILIASGVIGIAVGIELLLMPESVYSSVGVDVSGQINLLSDLRATGGALFSCGVVILLGAFLSELRFSATLLSSILYLGYGLSRGIAMVIDGVPADMLVAVAFVEISVGLLSLMALFRYREKVSQP